MKSLKLVLVLAVAALLAAGSAPSSAQELFENLRKTFNNLANPPPPKRQTATTPPKPF